MLLRPVDYRISGVKVARIGALVALFVALLIGTSACSSGKAAGPVVSAPPPTVRTQQFTEVFATPLPGDVRQAKVIAGFREGMVLWNESEENQGLVAPVTSYITGAALQKLKAAITGYKQRELIPAGKDRLFKTRVTAVNGQTATLTTCDDGSGFKEVNPATGAVDPSSVSLPVDQEYLFETWHMTSLGGHWAVSSFTIVTPPTAAAKPCLP